MARRPTAPRARATQRRHAPDQAPASREQPRSPRTIPGRSRSVGRPAPSDPRPEPAEERRRETATGRGTTPRRERTSARPHRQDRAARPNPAAGRPKEARREPTAPAPRSEGRVVQAAHRFRGLLSGRPWRRRRRAILATLAVIALLLGAALATAIWLPALRVQQITVSGLGYVSEQEVLDQVRPREGDSVLLLPTTRIAEQVAEIPGVEQAEVERRWPDGMHVTVVESEPAGLLTRMDGSTVVISRAGEELPPAAAEGTTLVPMTVAPTSQDAAGATEAMTEVLAELPDPLRGALRDVQASSASDVTLTLALEDGGTKTVVWGDARDAELKAEVVQALLGEPGTVIDVSSPVAPVTR